MVWSHLIDNFKIYFAPAKLFIVLNERPRWVSTFIIITVMTMFIGHLSLPFKQEIMFSVLSQQLGEARAHETLLNAHRFAIIGLLLAPIPFLLKWIAVSAIFYYTAILFDSQTINFTKVFSIVVHSELIFLLMGIANIIILEMNGIDSIKGLTDLQAIVGLEYFLNNKGENIYLFTLLSNFNTFTVWYVFVLTIGFSIVSQLKKWQSAAVVSFVWFLGIGFQIAVVYLSTNLQAMIGR
jgi:hypothetical protein